MLDRCSNREHINTGGYCFVQMTIEINALRGSRIDLRLKRLFLFSREMQGIEKDLITSIPNFLISYLPRKLHILKILAPLLAPPSFQITNERGGGVFLHLARDHPRKTTWLIATILSCERISTLAAQLRGWRCTHDGWKNRLDASRAISLEAFA